jgi:N-carbamoylputrescine amidase
MTRADPVRVALVQGRAAASPAAALAELRDRIAEAAARGARIVCTQELATTPYFCRTQDPAAFDLAEPVPGPTTEKLARLAADLGVVVIAALFEKRAPGIYHNTAAVLDADGRLCGCYRKMHIPQDPGFEEKFYFTPGDLGFRSFPTRYGRIAVLICWDQWFPEAARLAALDGAEILFYPTAIGWLPEEKAALGAAQREAWQTVQRGHAVANGCYLAAVNRVGVEGRTEFWGHSFVADYLGRVVAQGSEKMPELVLADCDLRALEEHRRMWPFFRDRRIDAYDGLLRRFGHG